MGFFFRTFALIFLFLLNSCVYHSRDYVDFYSHLRSFCPPCKPMHEDEYFLIVLVDACHLDYSDADGFFKSVAIHPMNRHQGGDVGHAWIYLKGKLKNGKTFILEGGHSGEKEEPPVRYFDGIMNYNDYGYANPGPLQFSHPRYEENPIKYLWTTREDGFFQKGSGGHYPTFAAKVTLSQKQFEDILTFIRPSSYSFHQYALMGRQCCTFVAQVAAIAGLSLNTQTTMRVSPLVFYGKTWIRLWQDPVYSTLTFSTPDILEKSLMEAVQKGDAQYALDWYLNLNKRLAKDAMAID